MKKTYLYFEYKAASLYFEDVKLHTLTDQADSGILIQEGEWDTGLREPARELNFHTLWETLDEVSKTIYRNIARHDLYGEKEIHRK